MHRTNPAELKPREYVLARIRLLAAMARVCDTPFARAIFHHVNNNADNSYASCSLDVSTKIAISRKGVHKYNHKRRTAVSLSKWLHRVAVTVRTTAHRSKPYSVNYVGDNPRSTQSLFHSIFIANYEAFVEQLAYKLSTVLLDIPEPKLLSGDDLAEAYANNIGESSCMTGNDAYDLVSLWACNPCTVKLAVMQKGEIEARALLWSVGSRVYLDRVYPNHGLSNVAMRQWAASKGYWLREGDGLPSGNVVFFRDQDGRREFARSLFVTLNLPSSDKYPYADSFRWVDKKSCHTITLSNSDNHGDDGVLSSTGGDIEDVGTLCERCDCWHCEDDMTYTDEGFYCSECLEEHYRWCEDVCELVPVNNCYLLHDGTYETDAIECESCSDMFSLNSKHVAFHEHTQTELCSHCYEQAEQDRREQETREAANA